jgi:cobalt-zinc-cadmium efflux system outer membrane protein
MATALSLAHAETSSTAAPATTTGAGPTLRQAFDQAWQRLPAAQALPSRQTQARAEAELAAAWTPAPAKATLSALSGRFKSGSDAQEWELELGVPLWLSGQREAQRAVADAQASQLDTETRARQLELAAAVREAWWRLAAAINTVSLADGRLKSASALFDDVDRRRRAGDLARVDANVAHAEVQVAQADAIEATRDLHTAQSAWRALTGAPPPESPAAEAEPPSGIAADVDSNPRLLALGHAAQLARLRLRLLDKSTRDAPELTLRALRVQGERNEAAANAIGIKLTVPFSSAPRQARDSAGLGAELAEAEAQREQLRRQLLSDIDSARYDLQAAQARLELAESRAALAADTLQLTQRSFSLGEADLATLLRARAAAFDAQAERDRQRIARAVAISQLNQAMGNLP